MIFDTAPAVLDFDLDAPAEESTSPPSFPPPQTQPPLPPTPPKPTLCVFAAAVLKVGGQVHRLPDGAGGHYEIAVLNPGALGGARPQQPSKN